jgi:hypothetical protein
MLSRDDFTKVIDENSNKRLEQKTVSVKPQVGGV